MPSTLSCGVIFDTNMLFNSPVKQFLRPPSLIRNDNPYEIDVINLHSQRRQVKGEATV